MTSPQRRDACGRSAADQQAQGALGGLQQRVREQADEDHADGGCCSEPQCVTCQEYLVQDDEESEPPEPEGDGYGDSIEAAADRAQMAVDMSPHDLMG